MTQTTPQIPRTDLKRPDDRHLASYGLFHIHGCTYGVTFGHDRTGLSVLLDFFDNEGGDEDTSFLYIRPDGIEFPSASLRFAYNRQHGVAAAIVVAVDRKLNEHSWMTRGDAGCDDVILWQDSGARANDNTFPAESFITTAQLRDVVTQWVFGEVLPPPAVEWVALPEVRWF